MLLRVIALGAWLGIAQGRVQLLLGSTDAAIGYLETAAPLSRRNLRPIVEHHLAEAYLAAGRPAEAAQLLEREVTTMETISFWGPIRYVNAIFMLGQAYEGTGKSKEAAEQYRRILEMYKDGDPRIPLRDEARERLEQLQT